MQTFALDAIGNKCLMSKGKTSLFYALEQTPFPCNKRISYHTGSIILALLKSP